jgi:putative ABC transport system permease protein
MFKIALKTTLARKFRLLSTALAVTLGVAFLSGTFVLTDTIQRTFDDLFADVFANTDAYVQSATSIDADFGNEQRGPTRSSRRPAGSTASPPPRASCRPPPASSAATAS